MSSGIEPKSILARRQNRSQSRRQLTRQGLKVVARERFIQILSFSPGKKRIYNILCVTHLSSSAQCDLIRVLQRIVCFLPLLTNSLSWTLLALISSLESWAALLTNIRNSDARIEDEESNYVLQGSLKMCPNVIEDFLTRHQLFFHCYGDPKLVPKWTVCGPFSQSVIIFIMINNSKGQTKVGLVKIGHRNGSTLMSSRLNTCQRFSS